MLRITSKLVSPTIRAQTDPQIGHWVPCLGDDSGSSHSSKSHEIRDSEGDLDHVPKGLSHRLKELRGVILIFLEIDSNSCTTASCSRETEHDTGSADKKDTDTLMRGHRTIDWVQIFELVSSLNLQCQISDAEGVRGVKQTSYFPPQNCVPGSVAKEEMR
jgi:hypothetical protein